MKTPAIRPIPALKTLTALALIAALAALVLYAALPAGASNHWTDYDTDKDGLIDIRTIAQLQGIRWDHDGDGHINSAFSGDLVPYNAAFPNRQIAPSDSSTATRMGCPGVCRGYELMDNLDFNNATTSQRNWTPPAAIYQYVGEFEGNGYTISNMNVNVPGGTYGGLFSILHTGSEVRNLGLINPTVSSSNNGGALAAINRGTIIASYVSGGSVHTTHSTAATGGLVGNNAGAIIAGFATAAITHSGAISNYYGGGLAGNNAGGGRIIASYAAGAVSTYTSVNVVNIGGLVGRTQPASVIIDSHCDTQITTQSVCIGAGASAAATSTGYTTAELQEPVGYTGIFANWNVDLDGDTFPDNPWHFGTSTSSPGITDPKTSDPPAANQRTVDHDPDDDNLINVDNLHQLNAIRHDLNGDGLPAATNTYAAYAGAFAGGDLATTTPAAARMGCPATCIGYELTRNLEFAADRMAVTTTDAYPNWTPIGGEYAAVFDGGGHTIARLTIDSAAGNAGLFDTLAADGQIRDLGMLSPNIRSSGVNAGAIAGQVAAGAEIRASYVHEGSITIAGNTMSAGGITGRNRGTIRAVYSSASVIGGTYTGSAVGGLMGVITGEGAITASYARGPVSASGGGTDVGGFVGAVSSASSTITDSYCDTTVHATATDCVGNAVSGAAGITAAPKTDIELKTPIGYAGIYANWNIDLDGNGESDYPWNFGTATEYPVLNTPMQRQAAAAPPEPTQEPTDSGNGGSDTGSGTATDTLPPPLPRTIPLEPERAYDPAADHPEIYANAEYEMAATCQTHDVDPETGNPQAATVTFDLGSYTGPILLHLSIWRNGRYMAYETQGIALPTLERDGQRATLRVDTDPAQTRFRLDGRRNGLAANLVLGYANCHNDES